VRVCVCVRVWVCACVYTCTRSCVRRRGRVHGMGNTRRREFARSAQIERQTRNWLCHHCAGLWAEYCARARVYMVYIKGIHMYIVSSCAYSNRIFFIRFVGNSYVLQYNIIRTRHPRVIYLIPIYYIMYTYIRIIWYAGQRIIIDRAAFTLLSHIPRLYLYISGWWRNSVRLAYVVYNSKA